MSVTLTEIAREAKVSIATVSYVLNDHPKSRSISDTTVHRVKKIADRYGYMPNKAAAGLKKGRHDLLALLAPHAGDFFAQLLLGIEGEGEKHDFQLLAASTFDKAEREKQYIRKLVARRVDGIIILPIDVRERHLQYLIRNGIPTICFRRRGTATLPVKFMTFNDIEAGRKMARHLIDRGCRKIAFCAKPERFERDYHTILVEAMTQGISEVLQQAGLPFGKGQVIALDRTSPKHAEHVKKMLVEPGVDGIIGLSDHLCAAVLQALSTLGSRVPHDIKLVGFGNDEIASLTTPAITSVDLPTDDLGKIMVQALVRMIEEGIQEADEVLLEPRLIERGSTSEN